jgi:hypothetical protein
MRRKKKKENCLWSIWLMSSEIPAAAFPFPPHPPCLPVPLSLSPLVLPARLPPRAPAPPLPSSPSAPSSRLPRFVPPRPPSISRLSSHRAPADLWTGSTSSCALSYPGYPRCQDPRLRWNQGDRLRAFWRVNPSFFLPASSPPSGCFCALLRATRRPYKPYDRQWRRGKRIGRGIRGGDGRPHLEEEVQLRRMHRRTWAVLRLLSAVLATGGRPAHCPPTPTNLES